MKLSDDLRKYLYLESMSVLSDIALDVFEKECSFEDIDDMINQVWNNLSKDERDFLNKKRSDFSDREDDEQTEIEIIEENLRIIKNKGAYLLITSL